MRTSYHILGFLALVLIATSCQRNNEILEPVVLPKGSKEGKIRLNVTPQHHKIDVTDGMIYIKYASKTMPPLDQFDDSGAVSFELGRPAVVFDSLTQGDYYIYAKGVDYTLEPGKDMISGGAYFRMIDTFEKSYDLYLQMDNPIHHEK